MKRNLENVFVIAQKEFADSIWCPRFYLILGIFMTALLVLGYQAGQNISGTGEKSFGGISPLTAVSTFTKESSDSLIYSIAVWLVLGLLLSMVAYTAAGIITGQQKMFEISSDDPSSMEKMKNRDKIAQDIMSLSPSTHFTELITGPQQAGGYIVMPAEGVSEKPSEMRGLFDTGFTLGYWVEQNWVNLVVLIVIPVILLLVSYMAFMRQDITL